MRVPLGGRIVAVSASQHPTHNRGHSREPTALGQAAAAVLKTVLKIRIIADMPKAVVCPMPPKEPKSMPQPGSIRRRPAYPAPRSALSAANDTIGLG